MTRSESIRTRYEAAFGAWSMRIADVDEKVDAALEKALESGVPWNRRNDPGEELPR